MPIVVKNFRWEESEKDLFITIPLKGVKTNKVDILSTESYIKVSFPPYIFECFLRGNVKDSSGAAKVGNGAVIFKLEKDEAVLWEELQHPNKDDKNWAREQRDLAIQRVQERTKKSEEDKAEQRRELERKGVREQMSLEDADRNRIENVKNAERQKVTKELEVWSKNQQELAEKEKEAERIEKERQTKEDAAKKAEAEKAKRKKASEIFKEEAGNAPIRKGGNINISFTPRVFPTPQRESVSHEEEAWLKKQAEARRVIETADADLTDEERNPVFMKEKADKFFKAGDFQAAVNAYSTAIRFSPKLPALFSNRAACHLKLNNLFKCADDCSKALELLTPPVQQNAASRFKAHVRRGTAYAQLELYVEGLQDYEAALKIDPNNEQVKEDADKLRNFIQTSSDYT